jgi:hypothetical protein
MVEKIFALINAAIVIGAGIYVFRRFLMPTIQDAIKIRLLFVKNLHNTHSQLKIEQEKLDQDIKIQEKVCKELAAKIKRWKEAFETAMVNEIEKENIYREHLVAKFRVQLANSAIEIAQKQIAPRLVHVLDKELSDYYENKEHTQEYIHYILDYLNEKKS